MTDTAELRAEALDKLHPEIYGEFCKIAFRLRERGITRFSARMIGERIRWNTAIGAEGALGESLKIKNNYIPVYARLLERDDPSFTGFFEKRSR